MLKSGDSIALLLDSAPRTWTSQEDIHLRLCRTLRDRGISLTLVFANPISDQISSRFRDCGAGIEVANYHEGPLHYLKRLKAIIAQYRISLIHVCFFDYFSAIPWLARLSGAKRILFEQLNSGQLAAVSWRKQLIRLRGAIATAPAAKVIAISGFVKNQLETCGVSGEKIAVRHLGVDTERFVPNPEARESWEAKLQIRPEEIIISTVSVLRAFKNPETIVRAGALLKERFVPFRLLVAGDGDMLGGLQKLADGLGISRETHWLGYCADPKSLLQASDIFVLASEGEAFGLVLAEAMACGVPVVGSRSGAIPEIVDDGHSGLLATPRDEVSFADALERLARDHDWRRELGANSLERAREYFSVDRSVAGTLAVYDSI